MSVTDGCSDFIDLNTESRCHAVGDT